MMLGNLVGRGRNWARSGDATPFVPDEIGAAGCRRQQWLTHRLFGFKFPSMPRQYSRPFIVSRGTAASATYALSSKRVSSGGADGLDEAWLQRFIFEHAEILPVDEIEPVFAPLVPLCRELPTSAGPLDMLFGTTSGLLTLVECKLWKNPEARREVVGQILDYAKDISRWGYEDLEHAVRRAGGSESLYSQLSGVDSELDEAAFTDAVARNLRRGRFLLLIVGEGIRESVEEIGEFLQAHAHLNFSFALVETALFDLPSEIGGGMLVAPRVLCRTVEIERAVVRIEDGGIVVSASPVDAVPPADHGNRQPRTKISEQVFYEGLDVAPATVFALTAFFERAKEMGLAVIAGSNSLSLKSDDGEFNFAVFRADGRVRNKHIASKTIERGIPEIGKRYLDCFAALFEGGEVDTSLNPAFWTVKKNGAFLTIAEVMAVQERWLDLIRETLAEIDDALR
jgi:hypothetical protein